MGKSARNRDAVPPDDFADRTLDRLVNVGSRLLPAYPNHPDSCKARSEGSVTNELTRRRYSNGTRPAQP
jgi:hypothetical protein